MNRDFELKQLLRAYRKGALSEAALVEEIERLTQEAPPASDEPEPVGFQAFGRIYRTERDAVVTFLDRVRAAQTESAIAFARWAGVCQTQGLRTTLWMIAEREGYHARIFEKRLKELGARCEAVPTDHERQLLELLANPEVRDVEKMQWFVSDSADPEVAIKPIVEFAARLEQDLDTRYALRLFAEDELSTTAWLRETCLAMTQAQDDGSSQSAPED